MSAIELDPRVPDLRAPAELVARVAGTGELGGGPDADDLTAAGVLAEGGALHPSLEELRELIAAAHVRLTLERGRRIGHGWLARGRAVLAHPLDNDRARLTALPGALLLDALVRLNDIGPRPRVEPAIRIALAPGALAAALAGGTATAAGITDPDQARAFAALLAGLREHWRVTVAWDPADGALGGRRLEVLDTDGGYWLVVPDDPTVELWPTTPTHVYKALCELFPVPSELRAWETT